jgi:type IV secretory pathway VirB2 component (pilin)
MKKIRIGTNFTIFIIFFGVSLFDAFQSGNWQRASFWLAIGLLFLATDSFRKEKKSIDR